MRHSSARSSRSTEVLRTRPALAAFVVGPTRGVEQREVLRAEDAFVPAGPRDTRNPAPSSRSLHARPRPPTLPPNLRVEPLVLPSLPRRDPPSRVGHSTREKCAIRDGYWQVFPTQLLEQQSALMLQLSLQHTAPRQTVLQHSPDRVHAAPSGRQPHSPLRQLTPPQHWPAVQAANAGLQPQMPPPHEPRQQSESTLQAPPPPAQHLPKLQTVLQHSAPPPHVELVVLQLHRAAAHWPLQQSPGREQDAL